MQSIRQIEKLNQIELEKCIAPNASWHNDYRDTAYIYIGGLPFELSEGDVLTIFSQYGNPVHINMIRDKDTGKSRGFCFLKYEDQRSCDLAVDNLSGASVMGRLLSVDHTRYKKKDGEVEGVGDVEDETDNADDTDKEGASRRKRRRMRSLSESEEERPLLKEEIELAKLLEDYEDDDPMKAYLVEQKKAEVADALKAVVKTRAKSGHKRSHRDSDDRHRHHRSRRAASEDRDGAPARRERRKHRGAAADDQDDGTRPRRRHGEGSDDEDRGHRYRRRDGEDRFRERGEDDAVERRYERPRKDRSRTPDDREEKRRAHRHRESDSEDEHERRRRRDRDDSRDRYDRRRGERNGR